MKYVIVLNYGVEVARLGSEVDGHLSLFNPEENVIAAGFCSLQPTENGIKVHVWGQSRASQAKSREGMDEQIIEKTISFRA